MVPHWSFIVLFIVLLAVVGLIVRWEFSRARDQPRSVAGAVKRYLAAAEPRPVTKEVKRGFDAWD